MTLQFKIGDRVSFLDQVGNGIVSRVLENSYVVVDEHGFEWEFAANKLVPYSTDLYAHGDYNRYDLEEKRQKDLPQLLRNELKEGEERVLPGKDDVLEIDLHIHELTNFISHLSNYEMVTIQLKHFNRFLNDAIRRKYRKLIVIHGLGEGVLRKEIRNILNTTKNCSYRDADYRKYGLGATEITLWYN